MIKTLENIFQYEMQITASPSITLFRAVLSQMSFFCNYLKLHVVADLLLPKTNYFPHDLLNDIAAGSCLKVICIEILMPHYTDMQFSTNLKPRHPEPSKLMYCAEFILQHKEWS